MEKTLVIIKPDAMERRLGGTILGRIEQKGFQIIGLKILHIDKSLAERHYAIHKDKPFFGGLVDYITSGPVITAAFAGENAVNEIRKLMGPTDPAKAPPGTIRGDFGLDIQRNSVHGSDSPETAEKEVRLFFRDSELYRY